MQQLRTLSTLYWLTLAMITAGCPRELAETAPATPPSPEATAGAESLQAASMPAAPASAPAAAPAIAAAARGLAEDGTLQVGPEDRCPVCAMKVAEHPTFASAMELKDGTTYYFCGTGCMLRTWLHPEIFVKSTREQVARLVVKDYFSGKPVDAMKVSWVAGSDVVGPMGPALVPIAKEQEVEVFRQRHGGRAVFRTAELTDEMWQTLTGKPAAPWK